MESEPSMRARVICTREESGELEQLIAAAGYEPVHVPLISVVDADDDQPLRSALDDLDTYGWLVVTSRHGAARVGAAAARRPHLRLAAVGAVTAQELATRSRRRVDLVPARQNADGLAAAFPPPEGGPDETRRILLAQADRADNRLADRLGRLGYRVDTVTAYRTIPADPTPSQRLLVRDATAVTFASGSAAAAWGHAFGAATPPLVIAIGPTTAAVASESGLEVTHIAADHSVKGLANTTITALNDLS